MESVTILALYTTLCALIAYEAALRGRFFVGIFVFSFLLTPFATLWYLVISSPAGEQKRSQAKSALPKEDKGRDDRHKARPRGFSWQGPGPRRGR
jgi:hypothetical protein